MRSRCCNFSIEALEAKICLDGSLPVMGSGPSGPYNPAPPAEVAPYPILDPELIEPHATTSPLPTSPTGTIC
jgi:hypothetical protein